MKNGWFLFLSFALLSFGSSPVTKQKTIGNPKGYNLLISVTSDKDKKANAFHEIVSEKVIFRLKQKILSTKKFTIRESDGYALSDICMLKYKNQLYYELNFYRSNGSPEIGIIYSLKGERLVKWTATRSNTTYTYFKKDLSSNFYDKLKFVKRYDLMDLW